MSQSPKDLVIKRLKGQLEKYKAKLNNQSFDNLSSKIEELENDLSQKEKIIKDLKETANIGGGEGSNDKKVKTKLIVAQSKLRKAESKIKKLEEEKNSLERQLKRARKNSSGAGQVDVLKRQLDQEMKTSERLRAQINRLSEEQGSSANLKAKIRNLENQLEQAEKGGISAPGNSNSSQIAAFKREINKLRKENKELNEQIESLSSGGGGSPMATLRLKRKINSLESQIKMLKKDKKQMQRKYEQSIRKSDFSFDDGW